MKLFLSIILTVSFFATVLYAQELPADKGPVKDSPAGSSLTAIASTAPGGFWSLPSTWVGGMVPGPGDDVTISAGSAVVIDTAATAANLTVGPDIGFNVGVLTFDPTTARALTVNGNLTVSGLGLLSTPTSGAVTTHTITVGGNLTNNGILDLSTNTNQTGAGLVFTGASSNTFGGGGSQTNIRTITVNKGTTNASTITLSVLNFTVQGSATDTAASGYLTLTNGTFKISGTFSGNHRTFPTPSYAIPATAGFWLNNPNYTVTAQNGDAVVLGTLQITTGVYNVGTAATDALRVAPIDFFTGGWIIVEGGSLNVSGAMRRGEYLNGSYKQYGGTTTTCIAGNSAPCFDLTAGGFGGRLVIQTPAAVPSDTVQDFMGTFGTISSTPVVFGNANTPGTGVFTFSTIGPFGLYVGLALEIDTSAGAHTVKAAQGTNSLRLSNVNIGPGGTFDIGGNNIDLQGTTFLNNGTFKLGPNTRIDFVMQGPADVTFSGSGVVSGAIGYLGIGAGFNLILDPGLPNIHVRDIYMDRSSVTNAYRLTLGINDAIPSTITLSFNASLDSAPVFDLGTGGQKVVYGILGTTSRDTGNEINPSRQLAGLSAFGGNCCTTVLNVTGGDLTVNGPIDYNGIINMGGSKLRHLSGPITAGGFRHYVIGTVVRRFSEVGQTYDFPTGDTQFAPARVTASSLPSGPADVEVNGSAPALVGLNPSISAPFHWNIEQSGTMTSKLEFIFLHLTNSGSTGQYRAWRSTPSGPVPVAGTSSSSAGIVSAPGLVNLTASWGVSERPPPTFISISGSVLASNGVGIRNATVRISGPELPSRTVLTGTFGTYLFTGIESGQEYTVFVSAKRNRFTPPSQTIIPNANVTDLNFVANPPE